MPAASLREAADGRAQPFGSAITKITTEENDGIGERLRDLRRSRDLTQADLATASSL